MSPSPRAMLFAVIVLSACTVPLHTLHGIKFTGDRFLGLVAVAAVAWVARRGGLRWTPVHSALAIFAGAQVLTSVLAAPIWPSGPKFASVYVLGFACFALTAEGAAGPEGRRLGSRLWIGVGAALGLVGGLSAFVANLSQHEIWGSALNQVIVDGIGAPRKVFAAKASLSEGNLYSSFLLVPFALALWRWRPEADGRVRTSPFAAVGAIVVGLVFGLTRAAWLAMAALTALWVETQRPSRRQVAALVAVTALAFAAQALAIGASPLYFRVIRPVQRRYDWNIQARMYINEATVRAWFRRPLLGNGAGSVNALTVVLPNGRALERPWTGNAVLFVLHDSGVLGLATLGGLIIVVGWRGRRALGAAPDPATRSRIIALLAVGVALLFAYQFTHALWLMYPYVYLGLLTASLDDAPGRPVPS